MDFRMSEFTVAATVLLAASCAGTKQDAESSDVGNFADEASNDLPVARTTNADTKFVETPFEISPEIRQACLPYRIPQPGSTLRPDSDLHEELSGLTNCLVHGPLYDKDFELVRSGPTKSFFGDAAEPLRQALIDAGVNAYRLEVVPATDTSGKPEKLTLRLANAQAET